MNPLSPTSGLVKLYLRRLSRALRPLSASDRAAIVSEIETHIAERTRESKAGEAEVLASLGDPAALARAYLDDHELTCSRAGSTSDSLPAAMLSRVIWSISSFLAGSAAVLLGIFGLAFVAVAVLKPIVPRSVGLWIRPGHFVFGILASPGPAATEVLGLWIVPASLFAALLSYLAATALIKLCGRWLLSRSRAIPLA